MEYTDNINERRIAVWKLLPYRHILKHLNSFTENVFKCNFTTQESWRMNGKVYVSEHMVNEYTPQLRGVEILDIYHLLLSDTVVLTENQHNDFRAVSGVNAFESY